MGKSVIPINPNMIAYSIAELPSSRLMNRGITTHEKGFLLACIYSPTPCIQLLLLRRNLRRRSSMRPHVAVSRWSNIEPK